MVIQVLNEDTVAIHTTSLDLKQVWIGHAVEWDYFKSHSPKNWVSPNPASPDGKPAELRQMPPTSAGSATSAGLPAWAPATSSHPTAESATNDLTGESVNLKAFKYLLNYPMVFFVPWCLRG